MVEGEACERRPTGGSARQKKEFRQYGLFRVVRAARAGSFRSSTACMRCPFAEAGQGCLICKATARQRSKVRAANSLSVRESTLAVRAGGSGEIRERMGRTTILACHKRKKKSKQPATLRQQSNKRTQLPHQSALGLVLNILRNRVLTQFSG